MFMNPKNRAKRERRRRNANRNMIIFFVILISLFVIFPLIGRILGYNGYARYDFVGTYENGAVVQIGKAFSNSGVPEPICPEEYDGYKIVTCETRLHDYSEE